MKGKTGMANKAGVEDAVMVHKTEIVFCDKTTDKSRFKHYRLNAGNIEKIIFDLGGVEYISSAGLRVLVGAYQMMEDKGGMLIRNVTPDVMDVFEVTGLIDGFDFE